MLNSYINKSRWDFSPKLVGRQPFYIACISPRTYDVLCAKCYNYKTMIPIVVVKGEQMYSQPQWTEFHNETPRYLRGSERRSSPTSTCSKQSLIIWVLQVSTKLLYYKHSHQISLKKIQCDIQDCIKSKYNVTYNMFFYIIVSCILWT